MELHSCILLLLAGTLCLVPHTVRAQSETEAAQDDQVAYDDPGQSIDELIVNAANSSKEFEFFYDEGSSLIKVEFDMVYSYSDWAANQEANNDTAETSDEAVRKKRTAGIKPGSFGGHRWTNNIVSYQLANHFTSSNIQTINAAIGDWQRYTCLTFRRTGSGNRIHFKNGGGCYSRVGMVGGLQDLGLAPGCRTKGVVIHEIGHALGLHHEQTRPDRDEHVRIVRQNIPGRMYYNFQKNSWRNILNMNIPYDYTSIMHYGKTAFSVNGGLTIQTINPRYQNVIGNRHGLSFGDIKSINNMYNCKRHTRSCTKTDASCPGQGFVDKNCRCVCPGGSLSRPTVPCSGGGGGRTTPRPRPTTRPVTPRPTTRPTGCTDSHRSCRAWQRNGECSRNPSYMWQYCKASCNKCNGGGGTRRACVDTQYRCPLWRGYGFCRRGRYVAYMRTNCKKSCGVCSSGTYRSASSCTNEHHLCVYWESIGECGRNPRYMHTKCRLACRQCSTSDAVSTGGASSGDVSGPRANCPDHNEHCSYWAGIGHCENNPGYMRLMCRNSCELC